MRSRPIQGECNDRPPRRNPTARNSAPPLPAMPNAYDAYTHLARAYRIRTSHVRLPQMRPRRTDRDSVRSDGIRCGWLVHWRITSAEVTGNVRPGRQCAGQHTDYQTSRPNVLRPATCAVANRLPFGRSAKASLRAGNRRVSDGDDESAEVTAVVAGLDPATHLLCKTLTKIDGYAGQARV